MKHTPGPWKLSEILIGDYDEDSEHTDNRPSSHCVVVENDENTMITYDLPPTMLSDEFFANAELIAAAPELLDFAIQYLYSEHGICDPEHEAAPYTPEELKKMAQDAIAKATGGEK